MKSTSYRKVALPLTAAVFFTLSLSAAEATKKAGDQPAAAAASGGLPPARQIIATYVKNIGGEQAVLKHSSHQTKATYELPAMGLKGDMTVYAARPNRVYVRVAVPGLGEILSGFDGKVGWSVNPATGPQVMEGKQLDQTKEDYNFYAVLHNPTNFQALETVELTDFEGQPCYKLRLLRKSGAEDFEFFDAKTGLQRGTILEREGPAGTVKVINVLSDYKKFGELLMPTKLVQKMLGMEQVITLNSMEFDTVKDSSFEPPLVIKNLVK